MRLYTTRHGKVFISVVTTVYMDVTTVTNEEKQAKNGKGRWLPKKNPKTKVIRVTETEEKFIDISRKNPRVKKLMDVVKEE